MEVIPTGSLRLDIALCTGGIVPGQFVEISGPESSGKTTLCQHIIAEAQALGESCAFIDADRTFNPAYARRCGVDLNRLYLCEPRDMEQALAILEALVFSGGMAVIAIDSLTALVPKDELAAPLGADLASQSDNLLSMALRRLSGPIQQVQSTILFTRQTEAAPGAVYHDLAANLSRLGLKLHAGLRIELQPAGVLEIKGQIIGNQIIVRVLRNKIAPCFPTLKLDIVYNHGIFKLKEVLRLGVQSDVITQQGPAYFFQGQELGAGRKQTLQFLSQDTPVCEAIELIVRQKLLKSVRSSATEAGNGEMDGSRII